MSSESMRRHESAYSTCAFCPKVCRFACPVSEATHDETTSTWGKMTAAHMVAQDHRPLDKSTARALHACTGCMRCKSFCKHENEVGYALFAARAEAVEENLSPEGASATLLTFEETGNPFGADLAQRLRDFPSEGASRYSFFPGCTPLVKAPGSVVDARFVAQAFGAPLGLTRVSEQCCGYPLYAAGAMDELVAHARRLAKEFDAQGEWVVLDPGCAYTLAVVYPRIGVELKTRILTWVEVVHAHRDHAPKKAPLDGRVAYHDACHLGRGLGKYEEPRELLGLCTHGVDEAAENRAEAGCSGGGGLLPRTMPELAVDVARRQAQKLPPGLPVVTACSTSRRMFERAGRTSYDLASFLRRWLEEGTAKPTGAP